MIFPNSKTPVLFQGITSSQGAFHAETAIAYGTNIVAGTSLEKGLTEFLDVPIFSSVAEAVKKTKPQASVIFATPGRAYSEVEEAIKAKIPLIVCTTEHVPLQESLRIRQLAHKSKSIVLGPSSPGLVEAEKCVVGDMPAHLFHKGPVSIISRSSSLTYEALQQLTPLGIGVKKCVCLGSDNIVASSFVPFIAPILADKEIELIFIIGDLTTHFEAELAEYWKKVKTKKQIVAYIAGESVPHSQKIPILGEVKQIPADIIAQKHKILHKMGAKVITHPEFIGSSIKEVLNG